MRVWAASVRQEVRSRWAGARRWAGVPKMLSRIVRGEERLDWRKKCVCVVRESGS